MSLNEQAPTEPGERTAAAPAAADADPVRYRGTPTTRRTARRLKSLLGWRLRHHLDQREAARILGVSQSTYGRFENGKRYPRPSVAKRIQIITGLSLETILGLE